MNSHILRWLASPFIVLFAFFASALVFVLLAKFLGIWEEPFAGFFTAFAVVIAAYWASPCRRSHRNGWSSTGSESALPTPTLLVRSGWNYKMAAAIVWFLVGASISGFMLRDSVYPEHHAQATMPTYLPLVSTYAGGLIALGLCWWRHCYKGKERDQ